MIKRIVITQNLITAEQQFLKQNITYLINKMTQLQIHVEIKDTIMKVSYFYINKSDIPKNILYLSFHASQVYNI